MQQHMRKVACCLQLPSKEASKQGASLEVVDQQRPHGHLVPHVLP